MTAFSWVLVVILANGQAFWQPRPERECHELARYVSAGGKAIGLAPGTNRLVPAVAAKCMSRDDAERQGIVPARKYPL